MKRALPLVLFVTLYANCAGPATSQSNRDALQNAQANAQPTTVSAEPSTADSEETASTEPETEAPAEFKNVDFRNFTYPSSFEHGNIKLKDGLYEYPRPEGGGGDDFELRGLNFVDLNADGKKEALVQIFWLSCGGSCDGGVHLFYVYSIRQNKPVLFWRIESGSPGYGGGLKSFAIKGQKITLELFNNCRYRGVTPLSVPTEGEFGKFSALVYTRFLFESGGRGVALKKREVFPFPPGDAKNYRAEISISNE